jgi:hypothetical protein
MLHCQLIGASAGLSAFQWWKFEFHPIARKKKRIQAQQSKHITNDDEDEWKKIAEYASNHQQAMDAHDIVYDIYRHAENLMHELHGNVARLSW